MMTLIFCYGNNLGFLISNKQNLCKKYSLIIYFALFSNPVVPASLPCTLWRTLWSKRLVEIMITGDINY